MSALLDEETTTVVLEGLDFDVPCAQSLTAPHAATHSATCKSCGVVEFVCMKHLDEFDNYIAIGFSLRCRACNVFTVIGVRALYTVVPL